MAFLISDIKNLDDVDVIESRGSACFLLELLPCCRIDAFGWDKL